MAKSIEVAEKNVISSFLIWFLALFGVVLKIIAPVQHGGISVTVWGSFAASGPGWRAEID